MHRRKSFLFRLFALLFALLLLITASVELALYHYARQVVGQEYIRLNQAGLRQISYTLGQGMTDTQTLAKRIAESTQLIELLSGPAGERADEAAHDLLYSLSSDYVWQRGIKMLMDSYVVGFNGVTAATYSSRQFNYDAVLADRNEIIQIANSTVPKYFVSNFKGLPPFRPLYPAAHSWGRRKGGHRAGRRCI